MKVMMRAGGSHEHETENRMYTEGYRRGMEDALRGRAESHHYPDDPAESRRRGSRSEHEGHWGDDPEMRRGRRTRGEYDEMTMPWDAPEEMRRRTRGMMHEDEMAHGDEYENEMRRGRRTRSEYEPESNRQIGYDTFHTDATEMRGGMKGLKDGTHEMGKSVPLDPSMESVLESADALLKSPPPTWVAYLHKKDYLGIAKMEGKELMRALEAKKPAKEIRKELVHTMAALLQLLEE